MNRVLLCLAGCCLWGAVHAQTPPPSADPRLPGGTTGIALPPAPIAGASPSLTDQDLSGLEAALNPAAASTAGLGQPQSPVPYNTPFPTPLAPVEPPATAAGQGFDPGAALRQAQAAALETRYRRLQHPRQKGQQVAVAASPRTPASERASAQWAAWERTLIDAGVPAAKVAFEAQRNPFDAFVDWAHRQCLDRAAQGTPCGLTP